MNTRNNTLEALSKDLDARDKWMGLRQLWKNFTPIPFSRRKEEKVRGKD